MLTSTFTIDNSKNLQLVAGLSDLTTIVIVIRKPRGSAFYICVEDWELFSEKLQQIDRKTDATFFQGSYMCATTTPQQHLILSYHQSWMDRLLHNEAFAITLSAKATSNLLNLLPTINAVLDKMKDFTTVNGVDDVPPRIESHPPLDAVDSVGFYLESISN